MADEARERAEAMDAWHRSQPYHSGPLVDLRYPMPLALASEIMLAIDQVCVRNGLEAVFKESDGLRTIHAHPKRTDPAESG